MNEQELLWLLARLYMVNRRSYITSHIEPLQAELVTLLSQVGGNDISQLTDDDLTVAFQPTLDQPTTGKKGKTIT